MGVDTSVLYLLRGGKPMKKIIAIILVITMLACNSVNAASFVQDKKVELNNEHMKDYNNSSVKWKFDEKSGVLSFSGCEKLEKVDVGQIKIRLGILFWQMILRKYHQDHYQDILI